MLLRKSEIGLEDHIEIIEQEMKNKSIKSDSDSVGNSAIKFDPYENSTAEQIQPQVIHMLDASVDSTITHCGKNSIFYISASFLV